MVFLARNVVSIVPIIGPVFQVVEVVVCDCNDKELIFLKCAIPAPKYIHHKDASIHEP
jgi:hypothetical protein